MSPAIGFQIDGANARRAVEYITALEGTDQMEHVNLNQTNTTPATNQPRPNQRPNQPPPNMPPRRPIGRTPEQVIAEQKAKAEHNHAQALATRPAAATAVAVPETRTPVQAYLDEIAPANIVGRLIKFSKDGKFITTDDGEAIGDDVDFTALTDQTLVGWIKFNGDGAPPDRAAGLLYDGFIMPSRDALGDDDPAQWEIGLNGQPADPWQHQVCLVLQHGDTNELFTYATSSVTGRRAIGNLLRHYDRLRKTHPDMYPVIRLKVGGFQHRDERVGWVATPVLAVVGRAPKDSAAKPDTSVATDMNDEIPFL